MLEAKIVDRSQLCEILRPLRQRGQRIVLTNGCFDLLHVGHVKSLEAAKAEGDCLVVGLNSDRSVRALKGEGRPIMTAKDRAVVLAGLASVDYVTIFEETDPQALIQEVQPDVLVKGADWVPDRMVGKEIVEGAGGIVKTVPYVEGHSTRAMIDRIRQRGTAKSGTRKAIQS